LWETVRRLVGAGDTIYISIKFQPLMISFFLARYLCWQKISGSQYFVLELVLELAEYHFQTTFDIALIGPSAIKPIQDEAPDQNLS